VPGHGVWQKESGLKTRPLLSAMYRGYCLGEGEGDADGEAEVDEASPVFALCFLCFFFLVVVVDCVVLCVVVWSDCGFALLCPDAPLFSVELLCPDELLPLCPDELLPLCATANAPPSASAQIVMRIFFIAFSFWKRVCAPSCL
jgi:hypothetical protein